MKQPNPIADLLRAARTIAVVGLSSSRLRPSFGVTQYMQRAGYRIIPVNPDETEVLGERAYASLDEVPEKIDIVNIFRRPERVPEVVEAAIRVGAKSIWMQTGIAHADAAETARRAGLQVIEDRCIMVDHRHLMATGELGPHDQAQ
jgi:hypothetical protein